MKRTFKLILLVPSVFVMTACISTAENIIDGVAAQGEKGLAVAVIDVEEDTCRQPEYAVGKVAMYEGQLTQKVTINRIVNVCAKKFDTEIDRAELVRGYRDELRERCDATLVRPDETNQYAKLTQTNLCKQLPEFEMMVR